MLSPTVTTDAFIKPIRSLNLRQLCGVQAFFYLLRVTKTESPQSVKTGGFSLTYYGYWCTHTQIEIKVFPNQSHWLREKNWQINGRNETDNRKNNVRSTENDAQLKPHSKDCVTSQSSQPTRGTLTNPLAGETMNKYQQHYGGVRISPFLLLSML